MDKVLAKTRAMSKRGRDQQKKKRSKKNTMRLFTFRERRGGKGSRTSGELSGKKPQKSGLTTSTPRATGTRKTKIEKERRGKSSWFGKKKLGQPNLVAIKGR